MAPGRKCLTVDAMSSWRGRLPSSQREARSTSLRPSSSSAIWTELSQHVVEQLDLAPQRPHLEDLARARVGARDLRRRRTRLLVEAERERGAAAVEHVVHHLGRHDLAAEPVRAHLLAEALRQRRREVALELGGQVRVLRHVRVEQRVVEVDLAVREQHRQLRPREPAVVALALARSPRRSEAPRARDPGCGASRGSAGSAGARRACSRRSPRPG